MKVFFCTASYVQPGIPATPASLAEVVEQQRQHWEIVGGAEVTEGRPLRLDSFAGHEFHATASFGRESAIVRVYLVPASGGSRLYVVTAGGVAGQLERPEVARFFDSFRILAPQPSR